MQRDFLVIDTTGLGRSDYLRILNGEIPRERVLMSMPGSTIQRACTVAKLAMDSGSYGGRVVHDLILLDPKDPSNQETTKFYSKAFAGRSYSYRIPCGRLEACDNPDGVFSAHYCSPSKRGRRKGPGLCRQCRFKVGASVETNLADRNRARTGEKRIRRTKAQIEADRAAIG